MRGTRDLLPPDTETWNFVEAAVREVFRVYNFQEIRTPIFESTELFARGERMPRIPAAGRAGSLELFRIRQHLRFFRFRN